MFTQSCCMHCWRCRDILCFNWSSVIFINLKMFHVCDKNDKRSILSAVYQTQKTAWDTYVKIRGAWFDLGCWPFRQGEHAIFMQYYVGKMHNVTKTNHSVCTLLLNLLKLTIYDVSQKTYSITVMQACNPTPLLHFGLFQPSLTDFLHTDTKAKLDKCKASEVFLRATRFG